MLNTCKICTRILRNKTAGWDRYTYRYGYTHICECVRVSLYIIRVCYFLHVAGWGLPSTKASVSEIKNADIPLLGIYPDKTTIHKDTCTPISTAALFTIGKTRKQPKCPSTDEWKKMWCVCVCVCVMEYYSVIKKNEMMPFAATWMDLEIIILSKVSQRKTNIIWYHLYMESKKWYKWTYLQTKTNSQT